MRVPEFRILWTAQAQKKYDRAPNQLRRRVDRAAAVLRVNPMSHPNIKRLHGSMAGTFRYRIGQFRLVYVVNTQSAEVTIVTFESRGQVYKRKGKRKKR